MSVVQIQLRRDTAANWTSANPVLAQGETGLDLTNLRVKLGDGTTAWNSLAYQMNTVLNGSGAPSASLGVNGDIYFDNTNKGYYVKAAGSWGSIVSLQGAQGIQGVAGQGVPTGGATGQYLRKTSATDYATAWQAISNNEVTVAMLADMPANTILANPTAVTADPSNLAIAANTFPARASTGDLAAKPVTDFGLSWLNQASVAAATAALNVATTTTAGLISAADKKIIDSLHYDFVADFGGVGNDSTLNDTAMATALSTMPVGAILFFPSGTYRFASAIDINVDKRIQFKGAGRYTSIIKTTSATAHIFTKSVAGWYDTWENLGFQSSVTKTAGAAINIPAGNNVGMNVYKCWFTGMFHAINATGAQSANLSVWSDLDISGVTNGGRGIVINGSTINVMIHNATINAGSATTSACVEINQSGAVQVTGCDWIQGTNVLLINSTAGAGPQACYFTNCFFDQPQGSVIKVQGTNTANRIKFTQCGIAPTGNNHAVEIVGTGAGAVGTATALPAGLSFVDCDIYAANGASTGSGIRINGAQDINIQNCRITGFAGSGGSAIYVTPSAGNQTKIRINGNILGPNSNLTITNETGVKIDAGASALGFLSITDNSMIGCTTAISDASTILGTATKNINNNQGAAAGLTVQASAGGTLTTTTETIVPGPLQIYLPPNSIKVGTTIQWTRVDNTSATSTTIERARIGTTGTTSDATLLTATSVASGGSVGVFVEGSLTFTSVGAAGTFTGAISFVQGAVGGAPSPTVTGTVNTTVGNYVTITTANGTANTRTFRGGSLSVISPA